MAGCRTGGKQRRVSGNEYCISENDRFSNLPDGILLRILEKLPLEEAMSTSFLARRWKNVWKSTSIIEVDDRKEEDGRKKGSRFLKKLIRLYQGEKLKHFSVSVKYEGKMRATYKSWLAFSISKNVEELSMELHICECHWSRKPYPIVPFPGDLFNCSSLVRLKLTFADFDPRPPFHLKLLRDLHLHKCQIPDDGVGSMTANCPLLLSLVLSNCNKDRDLKITIAPDSILSKLIIDDSDRWCTRSKTSISAPKITAVEILASNWVRKYSIDNVPDTVEASLSFEAMHGAIYVHGYEDQIIIDVARAIEQLQPAKMLRLCTRSILTLIEMREWNLQFNMTRLELDTRLENSEILGIILLLRACPVLEQLVINIKDSPAEYLDNQDERRKFRDPVAFPQWGVCLAGVEFKNLQGPYQTWDETNFDVYKFFQGCENGVQLLKLFCARTANIERIAFTTAHQQCELRPRVLKFLILPEL